MSDERMIATEVRSIVEDYVRPQLETVKEPGTNIEALALITTNGAKPIAEEVFDAFRLAPKFRKGSAELTSIESLIDHVNRFRDGDSVLFAVDDRTKPSITAVLDYHRATAEGTPRFGWHRSEFKFPLSDEWQAWTKADGQTFSMGEFAAFLEDRIIDVLDLIPGEDSLPEDMQRFVNTVGGTIASPSKLIELSVGLKVNEQSAVKEAINLSSGEAQVQFVAQHVDDAGQPLRVPGLFLIGIPVFRHGPHYRIAARLRYRKTNAGLVFFYQLWRADRVFDHSFREACERVRVETDLPMLFGKPE